MLSKKEIKWLRLCRCSSSMYDGINTDFLPPRRLKRLESLGLVTGYYPHNDAHKHKTMLTDKGREYLQQIAEGE